MNDAEPDGHEASLRQQTVLARFGELALKSDDLDEILTEACRLIGEALGTDLAKVMELQPDGGTLLVRAGVGWKFGVVGEATTQVADDTSEGYALKTGKPMISSDIAKETRFRYPSVDAPVWAREIFGIVIARSRMLPSVRPLIRQRTVAGLYGSSRVRSRSPKACSKHCGKPWFF